MPRNDNDGRSPTERGRQLILDWTRERGHGITFVEFCAAMAVAHPDVSRPALATLVHAGVRTGVLVRIAGRKGFTQYAHRDHPVPPQPDDGAVRGMLDAVYAAVAQYGRPVTTREVTRVARARGVPLPGPYHARSYLMVLARPTMLSADGRSREPKIVRVTRWGSSGMRYNYWAPTDVPVALPDEVVRPDNHTDIVRRAIAEVERELGRPVSRQDLVRWALLARHRDEPASEVARLLDVRRIVATLTDALRVRRQELHTRGVITLVTNQFTGLGIARKRYTLRTADDPMLPTVRLGCLIEDVLEHYRVAAELESIAGLEQSSHVRDSHVGWMIVTARRSALMRALSEALGPGWEAGLPSFEQSLVTRERWMAELRALQQHGAATRGPGSVLHVYLDEIRRAARNAHAARVVLEASALAASESATTRTLSRTVRVLDYTTAVTAASVVGYLDAAARAFGYDGERKRNLWLRVRRVPNRVDASGRRTGRERRRPMPGAAPLKWGVDRVDALLILCDAFGLPRASAAVDQSRLLLGHVVRDIELFRECLTACPPSARATRRALVLALALLGDRLTTDELLVDPADPADVTYACLAAVLMDAESAGEMIRQVDDIARGAARTVSATAHRRVRAGHLFEVVN